MHTIKNALKHWRGYRGQETIRGFIRQAASPTPPPVLKCVHAFSALMHVLLSALHVPHCRTKGCHWRRFLWLQVTLRSTNAADPPVVNTNIFGEAGEAEQMAACLNREREIINGMPEEFQIANLSPAGNPITADDVCHVPPPDYLMSHWQRCECALEHTCWNLLEHTAGYANRDTPQYGRA